MSSSGSASADTADKNQSTELVRIYILMQFSHVLWYRDVFKGVEYKYLACDPTDPSTAYDTFANSPAVEPQLKGRNTPLWAVLPRHQDLGADKLLGYLDHGVKEALENGSLSKLQLSFHTLDQNPPSPENLIESHAIGFDYSDGMKLTEFTVERRNTVSKKATKAVTVGRVKNQINYLLNQINYITTNATYNNRANDLEFPEEYRMVLNMKYLGPDNYLPTGFHAGDTSSVSLVESTPLDMKLKISTGHHSVFAGMILLNNEPLRVTQVAKIQKQTRYTNATGGSSVTSRGMQSSQHVEELEGETQLEAVAQIQKMGLSRQTDLNTQLIDPLPLNDNHSDLDSHDIQSTTTTRTTSRYTQPVVDFVEQSQSRALQKHNSNNLNSTSCCECQIPGEDIKSEAPEKQEDKVKCVICHGYRHPECYGYLEDIKLDEFVCYTCLEMQFPENRMQLRNARLLCLKRRTLKFVLAKESATALKEISLHLNCSTKNASEVLRKLKTEKYLKEFAMKKKGAKFFGFTGHKSAIVKQYFDPSTGMEDFLAMPPSLSYVKRGERQLATLSETASNQFALVPEPMARQIRDIRHTDPSDIDDMSTQGTPSPHPNSLVISASCDPTTPTSTSPMGSASEGLSGQKRKRDADFDYKSGQRVLRPRIGYSSPWTLKR